MSSSTAGIQSGQKSRKTFSSVFKRNKQRPPQPPPNTASQVNQESSVSGTPKSSDEQRTKARYLTSIKALEAAVKGCESQLGSFEFPELRGELEDFNTSQLKDMVNEMLEVRENRVNDRNILSKFKQAAESCFTTFTPFAINFLTIAKEGS